MVVCPLECIYRESPPTWLETHESFVLTIVASISAMVGVMFSYFLKSRCKRIDVCCVKCDREVVELAPEQVTVQAS